MVKLSLGHSVTRDYLNSDKNNDGSITMEELEGSLRQVTVKCPTTRCIYRCNRKVAHELFERIAGQGER